MSNKLPFISSDIPKDLRTFLDRVRESLFGAGVDRALTVKDLLNAGIVGVTPGGTVTPPGGVIGTPPTPTNLAASGALDNIILTWDPPVYNGHAFTEIWTSGTDNLGEAVLLAVASGAIYSDNVGSSATKYYWIRFVNVLGTAGKFNSTDGTLGQTGTDPAYIVGLLAGEITESELATALNTRIDLIDAPSSVVGSVNEKFAFLQGQIDEITALPEYDNGTTYDIDDVVVYNDAIYRAIQQTTGNLPTDTDYWEKIGDYISIAATVAANSSNISTVNTGLEAEVTARETLATQLRGDYTGTDITQVAAGLIFSERQTRVSADGALSTSIDTVSAVAAGKNKIFRQTTAPSSPQLNDIWVDTKISYTEQYFDSDYSVLKNKQFQWDGTSWVDITDQDVRDNFAIVSQEITTRASADEALATRIDTVSAGVDNNTAAIIIEATTRSTADAALASSITTLSATVAGNTAAITTEATTRSTGDAALASSITTLSATVTGNTTSIQTNQQSIDGVKGIYSVRIDNNGFLSGFGLISEFTEEPPLAPTSTFLVNVDKFAVAIPPSALPNWQALTAFAVNKAVAIPGNTAKMLVCKIAGTSGAITPSISGEIGSTVVDAGVTWQIASRVPFSVLTNTTTINGQSIAPGVVIDGASIVNATIGNAQIRNAAIDDAKISSLSADKVTFGTMSGERIDVNSLSADRISTGELSAATIITVGGSGTSAPLVLNGNGEIISNGPGGDKARFFSGDVEIYKNVPGVGQTLYKALSRVETGTGDNNVQVTIPGYFKAQPKVIVSPASIQFYNATYANQNQTLNCAAIDISESSSGSMVWRFTPVATLTLAANTGTTAINQTINSSTSPLYSSQYTTPANTASITGSVTLSSVRGNGASQYFKRTVRCRIQYLSGGTYISGALITADLASSTTASVTLNPTITFPSAGTYTIRIEAEAYDYSPSTLFGAIEYEFATDTLNRTDAVNVQKSAPPSTPGSTLTYTIAYTTPAGWTVTNYSYNYNYSYSLSSQSGNLGGSQASINGSNLFLTVSNGNSASGTNLNRTFNANTTNSLSFFVGAGAGAFGDLGAFASLTLLDAELTVTRRRPVANSTTPSNTMVFNSYSYNLSTAQVLATGTLNWMALGE